MQIKLNYDRDTLSINLPSKNIQSILLPRKSNAPYNEFEEVKYAMEHPIGSKHLHEIVQEGERVCIVTSDITRPMPSHKVLPLVLDELHRGGTSDNAITVVFALGNHRKHTEEEKIKLVGELVYQNVRCVDADQGKVIHMGKTSRGTPVDIFQTVANADRIICLGNIEYHYFAGYSGGAKALMPGVSTASAIARNHAMMVEEASVAGKIEGNNVRADIEEVAQFVPIDFIVNVILDEKKRIVKAVAGHHIQAHRVGCAYLDTLYKVKVEEKADIVVVSCGGFPKDINLYQAQKALDNAKHAVKDGGIIILCAACPEGLGEKVFTRWIKEATSPQSMVARIKEHFELGGHKAAAIAMVQSMCDVYLASTMDATLAQSMFFKPFGHVQEAVDHALGVKGSDAKVIIMPFGGLTLPDI